jgi:hypothetical protein
MEKIPCHFSQDIFTSSVIPARHGDSDCLKSPGELSFFDRLWISNSTCCYQTAASAVVNMQAFGRNTHPGKFYMK